MAADPKEYEIDLPLLVKEETGRTVYPDLEDSPFSGEEPDDERKRRARTEGKRKRESRSGKRSAGKSEKSLERKQAEEDWNAYLNGEPLKEKPETAPRRKGLHAGGIVLLILGILVVAVAAVSTYGFVALYLPLIRNGSLSFGRVFRSMLIFIGLPWISAAVLLVFAFTVGKRKR